VVTGNMSLQLVRLLQQVTRRDHPLPRRAALVNSVLVRQRSHSR
jgi:hypothetical protein